jgi:hypothetical protein
MKTWDVVLHTSSVTAKEEGSYQFRIVLHRDYSSGLQFITHYENLDEEGRPCGRYWGNYFETYGEALCDFVARCEKRGLFAAVESVRFWVWHAGIKRYPEDETRAGLVRVHVTRRRSITVDTYLPNEEGYFQMEEHYSLSGMKVFRDTDTTSRDCDGRFDTHRVDWCHVVPVRVIGQLEAAWNELARSQRDHAAEAAGY